MAPQRRSAVALAYAALAVSALSAAQNHFQERILQHQPRRFNRSGPGAVEQDVFSSEDEGVPRRRVWRLPQPLPASLLEALRIARSYEPPPRRSPGTGPRLPPQQQQPGVRWSEPEQTDDMVNITQGKDCGCDGGSDSLQILSFPARRLQLGVEWLLELQLPLAGGPPPRTGRPLAARLASCGPDGVGTRIVRAALRPKPRPDRPGWAHAFVGDAVSLLRPRVDECLQVEVAAGRLALDPDQRAVLTVRPADAWL